MNNMSRVWKAGAIGLFTLMSLAACVAAGYDGYGGGGYVGGVYAPGGYEYGGWGRGYRVGPGRRDSHWDNHGHSSTHSYRAAPAGRSVPSIPSRGHSGGGHSSDRHH